MLNLLNIDKPLRVNGVEFQNSQLALEAFKDFKGEFKIELNYRMPKPVTSPPDESHDTSEVSTESSTAQETLYRITVRAYMTKKSTPEFDLMKKINNDIPMPFRTMFGTILEESKGMYKMSLHAKPEPCSVCMVCGRTLTHPVSLLYGIGPECGGHFHINPFNSEEELKASYDALRESLANVTWEGWVVKKAITEMVEVNE